MSILDTLAEIVRNQHLLLSRNANNTLFYGALVHLVFMLSEKPDLHQNDLENQHLERNSAQVAMCAQSVWGILWQQKKPVLDEIFKRDVDLDLYTARASCGQIANRCWLVFVDQQTDCLQTTSLTTGSTSLNTQGSAKSAVQATAQKVGGQIQSRLRSGLQKLTNRKSTLLLGANSFVGSINGINQPIFQYVRVKIEKETFYMWIRVHISLLKELMNNHCQRYHEWHAHVRKWCIHEWHNTEVNTEFITCFIFKILDSFLEFFIFKLFLLKIFYKTLYYMYIIKKSLKEKRKLSCRSKKTLIDMSCFTV